MQLKLQLQTCRESPILNRRHEGDLALAGIFGQCSGCNRYQGVLEAVQEVGLHLRDLKLCLTDVNQGWTPQGFRGMDLMRADEEEGFRK